MIPNTKQVQAMRKLGYSDFQIEEMLEAAKVLGDLSDNAEYEVAITERDKCLERINNIKHILSHAIITDEDA